MLPLQEINQFIEAPKPLPWLLWAGGSLAAIIVALALRRALKPTQPSSTPSAPPSFWDLQLAAIQSAAQLEAAAKHREAADVLDTVFRETVQKLFALNIRTCSAFDLQTQEACKKAGVTQTEVHLLRQIDQQRYGATPPENGAANAVARWVEQKKQGVRA